MYYGKIKEYDIANGPGCRISLFVSGCRNHCKGCFNKETWDFNYGKKFNNHTILDILELLKKDGIQGLSILGGEPLAKENQHDVYKLVSNVKHWLPDKDIWLYTGYILGENIPKTEFTNFILQSIDVLVDGPFIEEEKDITLQFRGSKNQRIISQKNIPLL